MTTNPSEARLFWGEVDKKSDYFAECVSDVRCVGVFVSTETQPKSVWNPQDKGEAIVCDVAYQN